jgi:hypothetical protein
MCLSIRRKGLRYRPRMRSRRLLKSLGIKGGLKDKTRISLREALRGLY